MKINISPSLDYTVTHLFGKNPDRSAYRIFTAADKTDSSAGISDNTLLNILKPFNWGNFVKQLVNACSIASSLHPNCFIVISEAHPWLPDTFSIGGINIFNGMTCYFKQAGYLINPKSVVRGGFFDISPLERVFPRNPNLANKYSCHSTALQLSNIVREVLLDQLKDESAFHRSFTHMKSKKCVVAYMRGGDIFDDGGSNASYGQPPLAYYLLCIKHIRPSFVFVISQDGKNPCVTALIEWLVAAKIDNSWSRNSFALDYLIQLESENLILGKSSNNIALTAFSSSPYSRRKTLCLYEPNLKLIDITNQSTCSKLIVRDVKGDYRASFGMDRWRNTSDQRDAMVNYPMENLRLEVY